VAAFGGRPQLFNRIVLLSKEARMSSHRVVLSCAVAVAVLSAGTWKAVGAFPLVAGPPEPQAARLSSPGPLEQQARPITSENPVPQRTNYQAPDYPVEARVANARGSVTLMITVDELGRIAEVRRTGLSVVTPTASARFSNAKPEDVKRFVVNNNAAESEALRAAAFAMEEAALRAIDQWRYEPPASAPISFPIVITFNQDGEVTSARGRGASSARTMTGGVQAPSSTIRVGGNVKTPTKIKDVRPVYPPEARAANVRGMVIAEVLVGPDGAVQDAKILRSIPLLDQAALDAVMQWRFTPTLLNGQAVPVIMTVTVNFTLMENGLPVSREATHEDAIRRGTVSVMPGTARGVMPRVIKEVRPVYPDIARNAGVQGTVEVEVTIGTDGLVKHARIVRSLPLLDAAALDAVQQWQFTPVPEPVTTTIELSFTVRR
jgi:protein TonB